jgi:Kazal-type serine protease inhibitor domain
MPRLFHRIAAATALAAGALFLASCVAEGGDRPTPQPRPPVNPQPDLSCPELYQPVCAQRGNRTRTFSTACQAGLEGWRVIGQGECRGDRTPGGGGMAPKPGQTGDGGPNSGDGGPNSGDNGGDTDSSVGGGDTDGTPPDLAAPTKACTREYRPVCATLGGATKTFGNQCSAEAQGWFTIRPGEC